MRNFLYHFRSREFLFTSLRERKSLLGMERTRLSANLEQEKLVTYLGRDNVQGTKGILTGQSIGISNPQVSVAFHSFGYLTNIVGLNDGSNRNYFTDTRIYNSMLIKSQLITRTGEP